MPIPAAGAKKAPTVRGPTPLGSSITKRASAGAKRAPFSSGAAKTLQKIMEAEPVVEEVLEEVHGNSMTAQAVEPRSHEIELMSIPTARTFSESNEEMPDEISRRMSTEPSSDNQRRINRLDSEVQIEEILTRVFEDITTNQKPEAVMTSTPKPRSPMKTRTPPPVKAAVAKVQSPKPRAVNNVTKPPSPLKPQVTKRSVSPNGVKPPIPKFTPIPKPTAKPPITPKITTKPIAEKSPEPAPPKVDPVPPVAEKKPLPRYMMAKPATSPARKPLSQKTTMPK